MSLVDIQMNDGQNFVENGSKMVKHCTVNYSLLDNLKAGLISAESHLYLTFISIKESKRSTKLFWPTYREIQTGFE